MVIDGNTWYHITVSELFVLKVVIWNYNYLLRIFTWKQIINHHHHHHHVTLFDFKRFSLAWVHSVIVKNISISSYSSSCRAASMDLPDPLPQPFSIVHRSREVLKATSCIGTELLYIGSSWSSNFRSSMWRGPLEYIAYEFVLTSPAVSRMSGSSNLDSFPDGW